MTVQPSQETPASIATTNWLLPPPTPVIVPASLPAYLFAKAVDPNFVTAPQPRISLSWGAQRVPTTTPVARSSVTIPKAPGMPRGNDFSTIDPTETINGTFDFGPWLATGVSISSVSAVSCTVLSGTDAGASSRLIGSSSLVASPSTAAARAAVLQQWGMMVAGVLYVMEATVVTSDGQTLSLWAHQLCQGPN
jgi:hypothetical protein